MIYNTKITEKEINILKSLVGKKIVCLDFNSDLKNTTCIVLKTSNNNFIIRNNENPDGVADEFYDDVRRVLIEETASPALSNTMNIDKTVIKISLIQTEIQNDENDAPSFCNQNGLILEFDDKTSIVIHCIQSISSCLDIFASVSEFENSVKLEKEFMESVIYLDEINIKSKITRKYIEL